MRRQPPAQFGHAGGRGGGHHEFNVGQAQFERADELGAEVDFADADGVDPDDLAVGERLFEVGVVAREPLAEAPTPVAAPPHPPEIIRRRQREKNREQNVVKCPHLIP